MLWNEDEKYRGSICTVHDLIWNCVAGLDSKYVHDTDPITASLVKFLPCVKSFTLLPKSQ